MIAGGCDNRESGTEAYRRAHRNIILDRNRTEPTEKRAQRKRIVKRSILLFDWSNDGLYSPLDNCRVEKQHGRIPRRRPMFPKFLREQIRGTGKGLLPTPLKGPL